MKDESNKNLHNAQLRLAKLLNSIRDDDNFVNGIMWQLDHIDDIEELIEFIENEPDEATPSEITKYAVILSQDRDEIG